MKTVTAAIYARISQDRYAGGQYADLNVDDQIDRCHAEIERRGWTVGETYRDDSRSATREDVVRTEFERMLTDAPSIVVADKQDRLTRGLTDTLRLKTAKITGHFLDGGRLSFSTADEELMTIFRTSMDAAEGRKKAERQKAANLRYAKAGKYRGSIRPFGQTMKGEWVDEEADAVRSAASALVAGTASFYDIAKQWNAQDLKTPQTGKQGGREWTSGTVRNFYTRPRLIGQQDYAGTLYDLADWTPLLDVETFAQLQTLIDSKRTGQRGVSKGRGDARLLTGILKCECGRGMNVAYRGAKGSPRIYKCPTVRHQTVTAEPLERVVSLHALDLMSHQDEGKAEAEEATQRISQLLDQKRNNQTAHEAWTDEAVKARLSPAIIAKSETSHIEAQSGLDAEIISHRAALGVNLFAVTHTPVSEGMTMILTGWESTPMTQRRDVLTSLFHGVLVARGAQGKRFNPDRVSYDHTPLGERLYDRWVENYHVLGSEYSDTAL